jgi:hypothetical protein
MRSRLRCPHQPESKAQFAQPCFQPHPNSFVGFVITDPFHTNRVCKKRQPSSSTVCEHTSDKILRWAGIGPLVRADRDLVSGDTSPPSALPPTHKVNSPARPPIFWRWREFASARNPQSRKCRWPARRSPSSSGRSRSSNLRNANANGGKTAPNPPCSLSRLRGFAAAILPSSMMAKFACVPPRSIAKAFIPPPQNDSAFLRACRQTTKMPTSSVCHNPIAHSCCHYPDSRLRPLVSLIMPLLWP